jgi:hypothetical protein
MKQDLEARFQAKVAKAASGCHEWTGCLMPNGYGQIHLNGRTAYAHRVAWELAHGPIDGLYVLHRCDNRKCVNPAHLFLGSFEDNMADMVAKRRQAHGAKNGHAKLTPAQVLAIRAATGKQKDIASEFGVSKPLVSMIRSGRIWQHIR